MRTTLNASPPRPNSGISMVGIKKLSVGLDAETFLHRFLREQPRRKQHARIGGVGAGGDGRDDHGAVPHGARVGSGVSLDPIGERLRERSGHAAERNPVLGDQLLIARTPGRTVALAVDAVDSVVERSPDEVVAPPTIVPGLEYLAGVAKLADGMLFIHDLARFLSLEEEQALATAIG